MARRVSILALLAALAIGGCTYGTPARLTSQQEQARKQFIERHRGFDDHELARLCPGLYPHDFLTNTSKYPREKSHTTPPVTQADRDQARAAGCDVPSPK
jgi:hypothetical protein